MVVMNWLRPGVLNDVILPIMTKYELIDEIIISHGREDTYFEFDNPKIVNRKDWGSNNDAYGLSLRFLATLDAKNDSVLVIDDDCYPGEFQLQVLYEEHIKNPYRIVSSWGRILREGCKYNYVDCSGEVMISLTKCMLFKKELSYEFFRYAPVALDVVAMGKPKWNGEDIFMSAVSTHIYRNPNYTVPLLSKNMKHNIKSPTGKRVRGVCSWRGHMGFRTKMSMFCRDYFDIWTDGYIPKKKR